MRDAAATLPRGGLSKLGQVRVAASCVAGAATLRPEMNVPNHVMNMLIHMQDKEITDFRTENATFRLKIRIELPPEYGACDQCKTSPETTLGIYYGSRTGMGTPDWVKLAARTPVFWQPRPLLMDMLNTSAIEYYNKPNREEIIDWVETVSFRNFCEW